MMTVGSLFAGIGGFDLAATRCGMDVRWSCEIEPFARRVLKHHWPSTETYQDVRTIDPLRAERVDVITGGFPCQDLSVAGKRAGLAGERSGLFWEIVRLADALRPAWLVLENVPGLLSSEGGEDMGMVVGALRDLGYLGAWRVLDAQWFGVAQRRRRVFLVCCLGRDRLAALLPFLASGNGHPAPRREAGKDLAPTLDVRAGRSGETSFHTSGGLAVSPALRAKPNDPHRADMAAYVAQTAPALCGPTAKGGDPTTDTYIAHTLRGEGFDASEDGTGRGTPIIAFGANDHGQDAQDNISPTIRCGGVSGGGVHTAVAFGENGRAEVREGDVVRCLSTGGGKPGMGYPAARIGPSVRRLTPTECERLQGFSWRNSAGEWQDGHTCLCGRNRGRSAGDEPCKCPDGPRYRALGNAVAVPVVEWILSRVRDAEREAICA